MEAVSALIEVPFQHFPRSDWGKDNWSPRPPECGRVLPVCDIPSELIKVNCGMNRTSSFILERHQECAPFLFQMKQNVKVEQSLTSVKERK
jgi:hypothetical protein